MNEDNEKFCKKLFCESKDTLSGLVTKNKSNTSSKLLYSQFVKQRSINRKYDPEKNNLMFSTSYSDAQQNMGSMNLQHECEHDDDSNQVAVTDNVILENTQHNTLDNSNAVSDVNDTLNNENSNVSKYINFFNKSAPVQTNIQENKTIEEMGNGNVQEYINYFNNLSSQTNECSHHTNNTVNSFVNYFSGNVQAQAL